FSKAKAGQRADQHAKFVFGQVDRRHETSAKINLCLSAESMLRGTPVNWPGLSQPQPCARYIQIRDRFRSTNEVPGNVIAQPAALALHDCVCRRRKAQSCADLWSDVH